MDHNNLVKKYLGKQVMVQDKSIAGVVYAILVRPDQYGNLLKIAFGKSTEPIPSVSDVYYEDFDHELSCAPSFVERIL